MRPCIRQAMTQDTENVSSILREAAQWLEQSGWQCGEVTSCRQRALSLTWRPGCSLWGERGRGRGGGQVSVGGRIALVGCAAGSVGICTSAGGPKTVRRRRDFHPLCCAGLSSGRVRWAEITCGWIVTRHARGCERSMRDFGFRHHSDRQVGPVFVSAV